MKILSVVSFMLLFLFLGVLLFLSRQTTSAISEEYQLAYDDIISQKDTISRALSRSFFFLENLIREDADLVFDARSLISHVRASQHIDLDALQRLFAGDDTEMLQDLAASLTAYQASASRLITRFSALIKGGGAGLTPQERERIRRETHDFVRTATQHDVALMHAEAAFSQKINSGLGQTSQLIFYTLIAFSAVFTTAILFLLKYAADRRRAQERLENSTLRLSESEEKLRAIFAANPDPTVVYDTAGKTQYLNPAFTSVFGWTLAELQGRQIPFVPEDQRAFTAAKIDEAYTSGKAVRFATHRHTKYDDRLEVIVSAAIIRAPEKNAIGMVVNLTDISQQRHLEAQLQQAQKLESVGRLAGGVAHDFNNMLGVILGHTELAMRKLDDDHPVAQDLKQINEAATHSADLTRQLLAFARRQTARPRVLDLNDTIAGMLRMLGRLIGEDIELVWKPAEGLWPVRVDPAQVDQILANLCVNARDAIGGVGRVVIATANQIMDHLESAPQVVVAQGRYIVVTVSDNGSGMDRSTLERIFEPFFTTKPPGEGTGLGMATVYGIVKQNSGYIEADSTPGEGTTFTIYLPASQAAVEEGVPAKPDADAVAGGDETILLVEDEAAILDLSKTALENFGYTVLSAQSPVEALELAEQKGGRIDLLITDVVMPEMSGKDLKQRMAERLPHLKVLFMSGYTADIILHRGIVEADVHFLQKPFSINRLAAKVREVLDDQHP